MSNNNSNLTVANIFTLIKQSLNGEEQDYTVGSIRKAVFLLAIPMILEMMMESVFAVVDLFFVGAQALEEMARRIVANHPIRTG